eukprot:1372990-Pyramimonas_sp.AAC.1
MDNVDELEADGHGLYAYYLEYVRRFVIATTTSSLPWITVRWETSPFLSSTGCSGTQATSWPTKA